MKMGKRICSAVLALSMTLQLAGCLFRPEEEIADVVQMVERLTGVDLGIGGEDREEISSDGEVQAAPDWYVSDSMMGVRPEEELPAADEEEALAAAAQLAGIQGDAGASLAQSQVTETPGHTFYQYSQMYEGIPVYGRRVSLAAADGTVSFMTGNYAPVAAGSISLTPEAGEEEIREAVSAYLEEQCGAGEVESLSLYGVGEEGLCIYPGAGDQSPCLAYDCTAVYGGSRGSGIENLVVDASNGQVLKAEDAVMNATVQHEYEDGGKIYPFQADYSDGVYTMRDDERNFYIYNCEGKRLQKKNIVFVPNGYITSTSVITDAVLYVNDWVLGDLESGTEELQIYKGKTKSRVILGGTTVSDDMVKAIYLMSSAQRVYNFYEEVLNRKGFNGRNGTTKMAFGRREDGDLSGSNNAMAYGAVPNFLLLIFNRNFPLQDVDVVCHEYTHGVENVISSIDKSGQGGGLKEGYSDVMGEMAEAYTFGRDPDWENRYRVFHTEQKGSQIYHADQYTSGMDEHHSSTVVSRAAYLLWEMWKDGGMGLNDRINNLSRLMYDAMFLLPMDAEFSDWGWALTHVGYDMRDNGLLTEEECREISTALGEVGIHCSPQGDDYERWMEELTELASLAAEAESRDGTRTLDLRLMEEGGSRLIPEIKDELAEFIIGTECRVNGNQLEVGSTLYAYYMYALFGEDSGNEMIMNPQYFTYDQANDVYRASYEQMKAAAEGWELELDQFAVGPGRLAIFASGSLVSGPPFHNQYDVAITFSRSEYGGAFFNGYSLENLTLFDVEVFEPDIEDNSGDPVPGEPVPGEPETEEPLAPEIAVTEEPERDEEQFLEEKLAQLAGQWGLVEPGLREFFGTGYGGGETLVDPVYLTGLLCGDIYDYDGDGQKELVTVRLIPGDYAMGKGMSGAEIRREIAVYECRDGGTVEQADALEMTILGLPDTPAYASFQIFRGTSSQGTLLYLDQYYDLNSRGYSVRGFAYDGDELKPVGGAKATEYTERVICSELGDKYGEGVKLETWIDRADYNWEWDPSRQVSDRQVEEWLRDYGDQFQEALGTVNLRDTNPRNRTFGDDFGSLESSYSCCTRRPLDHYEALDGSLTELCGVLSPCVNPNGVRGIEMTWYDSSPSAAVYRP